MRTHPFASKAWQFPHRSGAFPGPTIALVLLLVGCHPSKTATTNPPPVPPAGNPTPPAPNFRASENGLGFRLSDAEPEPAFPEPTAAVTPLDEARAKAILAGLAPLETAIGSSALLNWRAATQVPPETGTSLSLADVEQTGAASAVQAGSSLTATVSKGHGLSVLRHSPDGEVAWAQSVSVTFSEPMIALGAVANPDLGKLPIRITPEPKGHWRWVGTQSLLFEPEAGRLAQATAYEVTIPSSLKCVAGTALDHDVQFKFATPPVALVRHVQDNGPLQLRPVLVATFNQPVEAAQVIPLLEFRTDTARIAAAPVPSSKLESDAELHLATQQLQPDHWVAFTPAADLPKDRQITLHLAKGVPAVEGPLRSTSEETFQFRTFAPLKVESVGCDGTDACLPRSPIFVEFNNALDARAFDPKAFSISPSVGTLRVEVAGENRIALLGHTRGNTEYTISVAPGLRDKFGQMLDASVQRKLRVARVKSRLFPETRHTIVLDPAEPPSYRLYSVNLERVNVKAYRVNAEDYPRYIAQLEPRAGVALTSRGMPKLKPMGKPGFNVTLKPERIADDLVETKLDLSPALSDGLGHVLLVIDDDNYVWVQSTRIGIDAHWDQEEFLGWTTSLLDHQPLVGTSLSIVPDGSQANTDANGIARMPLTKRGSFVLAKLGADTAVLDAYYRYGPVRERQAAFATTRHPDEVRWFEFDDRKLYRPGETFHLKGWVRQRSGRKGGDLEPLPKAVGGTLAWRAIDEREIELAKGQVTVDDMGGYNLSFAIPKTANLGHATLLFDAFHGTPRHGHNFRIEEFRRPEFELKLDVSGAPHFVGGHAVATLSASYFSGGGMRAAKTEWRVSSATTPFAPPHWREYRFGLRSERGFLDPLQPREFKSSSLWEPGKNNPPPQDRLLSKTGKDGQHRLRIDFDALEPSVTRAVQVAAEVLDTNRQMQVVRSSLVVHPASSYVGLRPRVKYVATGGNIELDVIASDIDGRAVAGRPVTLVAERIEWVPAPGRSLGYEERHIEVSRTAITSGTQPLVASLGTRDAGEYVIRAVVTDPEGRKSSSETPVWVGGQDMPFDRALGSGAARVVPDRSDYRVGDTARLLVVAPFAPFNGLLTVNRNGILSATTFVSESRTTSVEVPVTLALIPEASACVTLVGRAAPRDGEPSDIRLTAPTRSIGCVQLNVPPLDRTLSVELAPEQRDFKPSETAKLRVSVRSPDGQPASDAEVTLAIVDEAVLALAHPPPHSIKEEYMVRSQAPKRNGKQYVPDPIEFFYGQFRPNRDRSIDNWSLQQDVPSGTMLFEAAEDRRAHQLRRKRESMGGGVRMVALGGLSAVSKASKGEVATAATDTGASAESPALPTELALRRDYAPVAAYFPKLHVDRNGRAEATFKLPDSLTRYRVLAVAAAGKQFFGSAETTLTTGLPLMVRASPPRFLNQGDSATLPVVVQNRTDLPRNVDVAVRGSQLTWSGAQALRVAVPANGRAQVEFQARTLRPGTARFQVAAVSDGASDASEHELPVQRSTTTEFTATYGKLDRGAIRLQLTPPRNAEPEIGGLELSLAPSALQNLSDALRAVVDASFGDNEQLASQLFVGSTLEPTMQRFMDKNLVTSLPSIVRGSQRQLSGNNQMGTWSDWGDSGPVAPFLSIYATHALVRSKTTKGTEAYELALQALRDGDERFRDEVPDALEPTLRAYALHVLNLVGERDLARARLLLRDAGGLRKLPIIAVAWLLPVLKRQPELSTELADARRIIQNSLTESAGAAHVVGTELDADYRLLGSERRTDAIVLDALIEDQPQSTLLPKLVAGLLAARVNGQWRNTQENAWAIMALSHYAKVHEGSSLAQPNAVSKASAWLGDKYQAEFSLDAAQSSADTPSSVAAQSGTRSSATAQSAATVSRLPMRQLLELSPATDVVLSNPVNAPIYFRLGLAYAARDARIQPSEQGFGVSRVIEAISDAGDVAGDVTRDAQGRWHIRAGATVRIRVAVSTRAVRHQVAVVERLAAGFEIVNEAVTPVPYAVEVWRRERAEQPQTKATEADDWGEFWDHRNLRDDRVELFASELPEGIHTYSYFARATNKGHFVLPPCQAHERYAPEVFGRTASGEVVVQ